MGRERVFRKIKSPITSVKLFGMEKVSGITKKNFKIGTLEDFEKTYISLYLGNGTSDHRNEKTKTLCNTKYPPKPRKTHLRNHFWPLESGFSAIATYKTYVFSKSSNVPILKICGVISDTYPSLKSLTKVMEDFVF